MKNSILFLLTGLCAILLYSCSGSSSVEREDVAATNYPDMPNNPDSLEYVNDEKWINEYITSNPDMSFNLISSDTGEYEMLAGNYTPVVDNVAIVEDEEVLYDYYRNRFNERTANRATFNKGIDDPAIPEMGYPEYLADINEKLKNEQYKGTVFVELVVDETGSIDNAEIVDGLYGREGVDSVSAKVLRTIINSDLQWKPALKDDEPTSMRIELPVSVGQG